MSIPKRIHQCHFGPFPNEQVFAWMQTVRKHHPDWEIMMWTESTINVLGLDLGKLVEKYGHPASYTGLIRLTALKLYGGIYLDTDVVVLKPLDPLLKHGAFAAKQDDISSNGSDGRLCNAILGAEADHPFIQWQLDHIDDYLNQDPAAGIYLLSDAPRNLVTVLPAHLLYPYSYNDPHELRSIHPESFTEHKWAGSWK